MLRMIEPNGCETIAPAFLGSFLMIVINDWTRASSRGGACRAAPWPAAGVVATAGADARLPVCCTPITQPRMTPKHIPATAKTMDSDFMEQPILLPRERPLEPFHQNSDELGIARK